MSATIDTSRFAEYFSLSINNQLVKAVVYDLGKLHNYPVHEFYLDDLDKIGSSNVVRIIFIYFVVVTYSIIYCMLHYLNIIEPKFLIS